jgi:hypothetical protein
MKMMKARMTKLMRHGDEAAVGEHGTGLLGFGQGGGGLARQRHEVVAEVQAAEDLADDRHDQVAHQRIDDLAEGAADDHADGEVHHVALDGKLLEFRCKLMAHS